MKKPEEIFDEALQARVIDRIGLQDAEVYEAGLDAIKQASTIPDVVKSFTADEVLKVLKDVWTVTEAISYFEKRK